MSIDYDSLDNLVGSEWRFSGSTNETVRLREVSKGTSKILGRVMIFEYLDRDKKPFATNEYNFRRDFFWAERLK